MSDTSPATSGRDTAAMCHARAAADRLSAAGMDTANGRRKFEQSAANWDLRGELLGRLEASFDKRARLDAETKRFHAARSAAEAEGDDGGAEAG
jgi:hypothetical protein